MRQIIIKRKENQGLNILKVLAVFRDKNLILSLEDIAYYLKMYEDHDQIIVKSGYDHLDNIFKILTDEGVYFKIKE